MPAWLVAFLSKNILSVFSVVADILVVGFICYSAWNVFHPKPTTTQNQKASQIYNYTLYPDKTDFVALKIFGFEVISHHSNPTSASIKKVIVIPK